MLRYSHPDDDSLAPTALERLGLGALVQRPPAPQPRSGGEPHSGPGADQGAVPTDLNAQPQVEPPGTSGPAVQEHAPVDVWAPAYPGPGGPRVGLLLSFMLPSSAYATMLIREITRGSTSRATHAALTEQQHQQAQGGQVQGAEAG